MFVEDKKREYLEPHVCIVALQMCLSTKLLEWAQNCRNKCRLLFYASDLLFSLKHETLLKALMKRQNEMKL